jgi:hypothetical protein
MATLRDANGLSLNAITWDLIYEDGQGHHKQGILTFPSVDDGKPAALEVAIRLPGMRERVFQWNLPIQPFEEGSDGEL